MSCSRDQEEDGDGLSQQVQRCRFNSCMLLISRCIQVQRNWNECIAVETVMNMNPKSHVALLTFAQCFQVNTAILEQLIELRARLAKLLGFSSHANYVLEMTMAKNSENVAQFLGMFLLFLFGSFCSGSALALRHAQVKSGGTVWWPLSSCSVIKGIIHPEMKMWCCPEGKQINIIFLFLGELSL